MLIKVTNREAARILVDGGHVWDGFDPWAGCICGLAKLRRGKARRTRELRKWTRWCADHHNGWYIYREDGNGWYERTTNPFDIGTNVE